jgi:hypothetical protein
VKTGFQSLLFQTHNLYRYALGDDSDLEISGSGHLGGGGHSGGALHVESS